MSNSVQRDVKLLRKISEMSVENSIGQTLNLATTSIGNNFTDPILNALDGHFQMMISLNMHAT
jgi:hypothetical protein